MYNLVFFLHIVGVLAFVSGVIVAGVAFEAARRRDSPAEVATLLALSRVGVAIMGPGVLVAGACGLWLVHLGKWHYDSFWVSCSIVLFIAALGVGGRGGERPRHARLMADKLAADGGPMTDELTALLNDRATLLQNYLAGVLVLGIIALMCFKP